MFIIGFFTFVPLIKKFDIKTPGREGEGKAMVKHGFEAPMPSETATVKTPANKGKKLSKAEKYALQAEEIYYAVGGADNIVKIANCATRLRLTLKDNIKPVNDAIIKENGGVGMIRGGSTDLQIIIGTQVEAYEARVSKLFLEHATRGGATKKAATPKKKPVAVTK